MTAVCYNCCIEDEAIQHSHINLSVEQCSNCGQGYYRKVATISKDHWNICPCGHQQAIECTDECPCQQEKGTTAVPNCNHQDKGYAALLNELDSMLIGEERLEYCKDCNIVIRFYGGGPNV